MKGIIAIWSGAVVDIPAGWHLCDGNLGTPDLRNRFVVGAGDTFAVDETGGAATHDHDFTGDGHTHDHTVGTDIDEGIAISDTSQEALAIGTTDSASSLPPYYALAYIQKL